MAMTGMPLANRSGPMRDLVFISYSHCDKVWLERLLIFLKPYTRQNLKIWADPYIKVGDKWRRNISEALSQTCVAVLLVSPEFIASEFIFQDELPPLLAGADGKVIILVAIPISTADYEAGGLSEFQFAHPPKQPLDRMRTSRRNAALVEIVKKIVAAAQSVATSGASPPPPTSRRVSVAPIATTGRFAALHGVPGQRPNYLRRQEYLDRLKQAVLGATRSGGRHHRGDRKAAGSACTGWAASARRCLPSIWSMTTRSGASSRTGSSG